MLAMPWVRDYWIEAWGEEWVRFSICLLYIFSVLATLCLEKSDNLSRILGGIMFVMVLLFVAVVWQISTKGNISWGK